MDSELFKADEQFANELGHKLERTIRQCEEHASILRQDANKYAEAYAEYATRRNAAPVDTSSCIAECERHLFGPCESFVDHLQAFSSGVYLLRLYNQGLPDRVLFHARKVQTKFRKANPIPVDTTSRICSAKGEEPHPFFLQVSQGSTVDNKPLPDERDPPIDTPLQGLTVDNKPLPDKCDPPIDTSPQGLTVVNTPLLQNRDPPIDTPPFLIVEDTAIFSWDNVPESRGYIVESTHLDAWKSNETGLYDLVFTTTTLEEERIAFMVVAIMSTKFEKTFYILYADETEAYGCSDAHFTHLMLGAEAKGKLKH